MNSEKKQKGKVGVGARQDLLDYAKQFLLPIEAKGSVRVSPSNYPSQVCARHLHKTIDVSSATAAYANGFTIVMTPDLKQSCFLSRPSAASTIPAAPDLISMRSNLQTPVGVPGDVLKTLVEIVEPDGTLSMGRLETITDSAASTRVGTKFTPAAMTMRAEYKNKCSFPHQIEPFYKVSGGAWVSLGPVPAGINETVVWTSNLPANSDSVAFRLIGNGGGEFYGTLRYTMTVGQVVLTSTDSLYPCFERFLEVNGVEDGRVLSMSVLATNTSPEIANGGNINAGRVPRKFNPLSNVPQQLAALPENRRYLGPAKDGAYVSWMPSQFDEFEIDSVDNKRLELQEAEYIVIQVDGWSPPAGTTASFRIQFDLIVEFYTQDQLFEKELTPAMTPEFQALFHALLQMNAATCNPGHLALLASVIGKGINIGRKALKFYGENQKIIDPLLARLASSLLSSS